MPWWSDTSRHLVKEATPCRDGQTRSGTSSSTLCTSDLLDTGPATRRPLYRAVNEPCTKLVRHHSVINSRQCIVALTKMPIASRVISRTPEAISGLCFCPDRKYKSS